MKNECSTNNRADKGCSPSPGTESNRTPVKAVLRGLGLLLATGLLLAARTRQHRVYDGEAEYGVLAVERISEAQLVEYATYSGVYRMGNRLIRHDWAARSDGKHKCPT